MEVYEMPITFEESRNYHKFIYQLKMLSLVEWVKTYIYTVIFSVIFTFILFTFSTNIALVLWASTGVWVSLLYLRWYLYLWLCRGLRICSLRLCCRSILLTISHRSS
jgi:type III secretory pathway component EscU